VPSTHCASNGVRLPRLDQYARRLIDPDEISRLDSRQPVGASPEYGTLFATHIAVLPHLRGGACPKRLPASSIDRAAGPIGRAASPSNNTKPVIGRWGSWMHERCLILRSRHTANRALYLSVVSPRQNPRWEPPLRTHHPAITANAHRRRCGLRRAGPSGSVRA